MHSESSGFARTWPSLPLEREPRPSLPMSPELSGVVRAFRAAPAPGASRPLTSESLTGTTSRAFIPRASCVLASGRLSGVEPGMMSRALTPPHIRKAHALSHPEPHAPVAPSKLMRSEEQPHALLTKTAAGCGRILRNTRSLHLLRSTSIQ